MRKPDAQRAERRAHALRLIVRTRRIIGRVAIERLALAGGRGGAAQFVLAGVTALPVTLDRVRR
jgi:hypothetical protein